MDDATAHKIRDVKLRILHVEKELQATQHNAELGQYLRAGHATQMAKANERERARLEAKLEDLKAKLAELSGGDSPAAPAAAAKAEAPAAKPAKKTAATKAAAATKTAKKTTKK